MDTADRATGYPKCGTDVIQIRDWEQRKCEEVNKEGERKGEKETLHDGEEVTP